MNTTVSLESSETLVSRALGRIAELNPGLNAFITVLGDRALAQARTLDEERRQGHVRGTLHGLPVSIKDLIDVEGVPTTAASRVRDGHVAGEDAPVVARLRAAGAVIIGKCNLHEFALGTTSDESAYGVAHNPLDPRRSPGGSSGGSAAAVASDMSWASIGTDTGGSIRIPAAACGVVGLKPSFGEIPTAGVVPLSSSLDHVGPLAHTVADAWAVYEVLKGVPASPKIGRAVAALRIGKLGGYFMEQLDADVRARYAESLDRLAAAGMSSVAVNLRHAADISYMYGRIVLTEASAWHAATLRSAPSGYSESIRARLEQGFAITAREYREAQGERERLRREVDGALAQCDALVLPTLPIPAPLIGAATVSVGGTEEPIRPLMLRLTQAFNLTGHPAITLPCGHAAGGLPCGLQLVGHRDATEDLLRISLGCEPYVTPPAHPSNSGDRERARAAG